jgi:hypothetical protein
VIALHEVTTFDIAGAASLSTASLRAIARCPKTNWNGRHTHRSVSCRINAHRRRRVPPVLYWVLLPAP